MTGEGERVGRRGEGERGRKRGSEGERGEREGGVREREGER